MRTSIHRRLKDIPAHSCTDSEAQYPGYSINPFSKENMKRRAGIFYKFNVVRKQHKQAMTYVYKGLKRVMVVSIIQKQAYKALVLYFKSVSNHTVKKEHLISIWRESTINALVKKGLLIENDGIITIRR